MTEIQKYLAEEVAAAGLRWYGIGKPGGLEPVAETERKSARSS